MCNPFDSSRLAAASAQGESAARKETFYGGLKLAIHRHVHRSQPTVDEVWSFGVSCKL